MQRVFYITVHLVKTLPNYPVRVTRIADYSRWLQEVWNVVGSYKFLDEDWSWNCLYREFLCYSSPGKNTSKQSGQGVWNWNKIKYLQKVSYKVISHADFRMYEMLLALTQDMIMLKALPVNTGSHNLCFKYYFLCDIPLLLHSTITFARFLNYLRIFMLSMNWIVISIPTSITNHLSNKTLFFYHEFYKTICCYSLPTTKIIG